MSEIKLSEPVKYLHKPHTTTEKLHALAHEPWVYRLQKGSVPKVMYTCLYLCGGTWVYRLQRGDVPKVMYTCLDLCGGTCSEFFVI